MISVAAYLENEKVSDLKSEYVNGRCLPLVGTDRIHDLLSMRLAQLLAQYLRDTDWRVFRPTVKLHLDCAGGDRFYYPDIQVAKHGAVWGRSEQPDYLESPKVILEVLSPISERRDREEKATAYRCIQSLDELVLVDYRALRIELRRRRNGWTPEPRGPGERVLLESIGVSLDVDEVYAGAILGEPVSVARPPGLFWAPSRTRQADPD